MTYLYIVAVLLALAGAYRLSRQRRSNYGILKLPNGHTYGFSMGDNLVAEFGRFHGMDIELSRSLSDFYLDATRDSRITGPGALFSAGQLVQLEGDFNKHFQLYIPKGTHIDALSILSPDVMQTLISKTARFDIQLHKNHLRLISPQQVYDKDGYEIDLRWAAEALLPEIDQRLNSWQANDESLELQYKAGKTIKVGSYAVRRKQLVLSMLTIVIAIMVAGFGLAGYFTLQDHSFSDPFSKGRLAGVTMYAALYVLLGLTATVPFVLFGWAIVHKDRFIEYIFALFKR